jgi:hypothetical protein
MAGGSPSLGPLTSPIAVRSPRTSLADDSVRPLDVVRGLAHAADAAVEAAAAAAAAHHGVPALSLEEAPAQPVLSPSVRVEKVMLLPEPPPLADLAAMPPR